MQSAETTSPYPGPRPFTTAESARFFGRTRELQDVAALVIAQPVTVLHGPTGAGKTSLIYAGVVPELEAAGFTVLPVARVGGLLPPGTDAGRLRNVFTFSVLLHWAPDADDTELLARHTLSSYLAAAPKSGEGAGRPRVIIIDQLEALFTAYPAQWEQREAFLRELTECLRGDRNAASKEPPVRLLLAIRDDRLAQLEGHTALFPEGLRARVGLELLRVPAAIEAIVGPAGGGFSPTEAEQLARDLSQRRVRLQNGKQTLVSVDRVEPMQLQLACHERWQRGGRSGALAKPRDPEEALRRFYEGAIARARSGWGAERKLRGFVGERLLDVDGGRSSALRGPRATGGLANRRVEALEGEGLIRSETRGGQIWYELAHERLVGPAIASNTAWAASQARRGRAWRFVLVMLLFAGAVVGLSYVGQEALGRWEALKAEKAELEQEIVALEQRGTGLDGDLVEVRGALVEEQRRVVLAQVIAELRVLSADAQLLQTVLFDMGRYRPSAREVESEAETLINFVTLGQALTSVAAQSEALALRQAGLMAEMTAPAERRASEAAAKATAELAAEVDATGPQLARLQATLKTMTGEHARYSARLAANLDGWETPARPGASLADRVREGSRAQWRAGLRSLLAGDVAGARSKFERAVERDASHAAAHDAVARLAWSEGKVAEAQSAYRAALGQSGEYGPALAGMAEVYLHEAALADAERCARKALTVQPDYVAAHLVLGEVSRRLAAPEGALGKVSKDNPCKKRAATAAGAPEPAEP